MKAAILLVEDEDDVRAIITEILITSDYEVLSASDASKAFEILASGTVPDLIISDIMMPGKTGMQFFSELKESFPHLNIPFIFLTARSDDSVCRSGMNLGADDYLKKPFKTTDLLRSIELRLSKKKIISGNLNSLQKTISENIPHELRTPLVPILGFSNLLLDDYEDLSKEEISRYIKEINTSGLRLKERINKFLLYEELEIIDLSWGFNISKPDFAICNTDNLDLMLLQIASQFNRSSDLIMDIAAAKLFISPVHLNILMTEILENSFKFSTEGTRVEVQGMVVNNAYRFNISDLGRGFIMKDLEGSSEIFNQNSTGFGLHIINKILKLYHTRLVIDSSPGLGTKISFSLNLRDQKINILN